MAPIIWTYWENRYGPAMPPYLGLCLDSVRRHAGGAHLVVVRPETLTDYVSSRPTGFDALLPAHKADYLRVRLLHDHGGMWIDADTIVFADLVANFLCHLDNAELVFLGSSGLSQSFFASRARGAFVADCLARMHDVLAGGGGLRWSSLGADILRPVAALHACHNVKMQGWGPGWREWETYLRPGHIDMNNRLACMLYNKMMFPVLKEVSAADILAADTLLGAMLRLALGRQDPPGGTS
jgi:hypothetical protein